MDTLREDLHYAGRTLRARPGFTTTAVVTLALSIGGSTAICSLASAVLLGKLPFRDPEGLVTVWDDAAALGVPRNDLTPASYAALQSQNQAFEDLAAATESGFTLTGGGEPGRSRGGGSRLLSCPCSEWRLVWAAASWPRTTGPARAAWWCSATACGSAGSAAPPTSSGESSSGVMPPGSSSW